MLYKPRMLREDEDRRQYREGSTTIQRGKVEAIQTKKVQRGIIGDNTKRKDRGYTNQGGAEGVRIGDNTKRKSKCYLNQDNTKRRGGVLPTTQRENAEAIQTKTAQRGEDRDDTKRRDRGYRNQEGTRGEDR